MDDRDDRDFRDCDCGFKNGCKSDEEAAEKKPAAKAGAAASSAQQWKWIWLEWDQSIDSHKFKSEWVLITQKIF